MSTVPSRHPDDRDLVEVYGTQEESEALVVRSLLESAGIEALITGENPLDVLPVGGRFVRVAADDAEEAKRVVEDYLANRSKTDPEPSI